MYSKDKQKPIKSAVIVSKVYKRPLSGPIREIASLLNSLGVSVYLDQNTAMGFSIDDIPFLSRKEIRDKDVIIVLGGDGSVLGAARTLVDLKVPILGVNRGHLGLLTDVCPSDAHDLLQKVVEGKYSVETRTMLDVSVKRDNEDGLEEVIGQSLAMNETVIHSGVLAHMLVFDVSINDKYLYTIRGDGIIISTPTGSTAYSLSAGGPVIEPHLNVLSLVPMFAQSLSCSPIIVPNDSVIKIKFRVSDNIEFTTISCDGQVSIRADTSCDVTVKKHKTAINLIHPEGYDYYNVLRQKLGWGSQVLKN